MSAPSHSHKLVARVGERCRRRGASASRSPANDVSRRTRRAKQKAELFFTPSSSVRAELMTITMRLWLLVLIWLGLVEGDDDCQAAWQQCGGVTWSGATCCIDDYECSCSSESTTVSAFRVIPATMIWAEWMTILGLRTTNPNRCQSSDGVRTFPRSLFALSHLHSSSPRPLILALTL